MVTLDGVGEALDVQDGLVELEAVGEEIISDGGIGLRRGAEVEGGIDPTVNFCPGLCPVDGGHERVAVGVGLADDGGAAVGPVDEGEGWGVDGWGNTSAGW